MAGRAFAAKEQSQPVERGAGERGGQEHEHRVAGTGRVAGIDSAGRRRPPGLIYVLPWAPARKLRHHPYPNPYRTRGFSYPTSVFTAAVISASAFFASAKYMLVFGLTYSSLSMPA